MKIENIDELEVELGKLQRITREKRRKLIKLRVWLAGFAVDNQPSASQIAHHINALSMGDVQTAFNDTKAVFLNTEVIPDADGE